MPAHLEFAVAHEDAGVTSYADSFNRYWLLGWRHNDMHAYSKTVSQCCRHACICLQVGAHLQALVVHLCKPCCTSLGYAVSLSRVLRKSHADITNIGNPTDLDIQILCKSCKSLADGIHSDCIVVRQHNDRQHNDQQDQFWLVCIELAAHGCDLLSENA